MLAEAIIAVIKPGHFPDAGEAKRPVIINFRNCRNIAVSDVTLRENACWVQLHRDCERVTFENINIRTAAAVTNDGLADEGLLPEHAEILAIESDAGEVVDFAEIELDLRFKI